MRFKQLSRSKIIIEYNPYVNYVVMNTASAAICPRRPDLTIIIKKENINNDNNTKKTPTCNHMHTHVLV